MECKSALYPLYLPTFQDSLKKLINKQSCQKARASQSQHRLSSRGALLLLWIYQTDPVVSICSTLILICSVLQHACPDRNEKLQISGFLSPPAPPQQLHALTSHLTLLRAPIRDVLLPIDESFHSMIVRNDLSNS